MAPASVLARAAAGISIVAEADALGLADAEGDGEALLADAERDADEGGRKDPTAAEQS